MNKGVIVPCQVPCGARFDVMETANQSKKPPSGKLLSRKFFDYGGKNTISSSKIVIPKFLVLGF